MQCWKQNLAPLPEQQELVPSLQPLHCEHFAASESQVVGSLLSSREPQRIFSNLTR